MSYELQPYDRDVHANPAPRHEPRYVQTHVVVGEVPLSAMEFDPRDDIYLASITSIGHRVPGSCPRFDELAAETTEPVINGADTNQQLKVPCLLRFEAAVRPIAYPICAGRAALQGLHPDNITPTMLTERESYNQISCPFMYLGAAIANAAGDRVQIALDAYNPMDLDSIEIG